MAARVPRHTGFKIFVGVMLTLNTLLLTAVLAVLVLGGLQLASQAKTIGAKADAFSSKIDTLNQNLQNLQNLNSSKPLSF